MTIRIRPEIGQHLIINTAWMEPNEFFVQFMPNLSSGLVYEILEVEVLEDEWGIVKIKDILSGEIFDINAIPELESYWCIFDKYDSVRLVEI